MLHDTFTNVEKWREHYHRNGPMTPLVGMGATYNIGSDHYPYIITRVSGNRLWAKALQHKMAEGGNWFGIQKWDVESEATAHAEEEMFTWRKPRGRFEDLGYKDNGAWRPKGANYGSLTIGLVRVSMDPGF